MTIEQYHICRREMEFVTSRKDFISRFPDIDPGELIDIWQLKEDYSLSAVRKFAGLTQEALSKRYRIPLRTISNWSLHGQQHRDISPYLLDLIIVDVINERNHPASEPIYIV
mgnify:CR=1 FL=1